MFCCGSSHAQSPLDTSDTSGWLVTAVTGPRQIGPPYISYGDRKYSVPATCTCSGWCLPSHTCYRYNVLADSMADTRASRSHKTDERCRRAVFHLVCGCLDDSDEEKALVGKLEPEALKIQSPGCKYNTSPITVAYRKIKKSSSLMELFPNQSSDAIREQCKYWFWQAASSQRGSLADLQRRTKGDWKLAQEDFQSLANLLTSVKYEDSQGNRRYFGSLEQMFEHCLGLLASSEQSAHDEAKHAIRVMQGVRDKLHNTAAQNNLDLVIARVVARCKCVSSAPVAILSMHDILPMHAGGAAVRICAPTSIFRTCMMRMHALAFSETSRMCAA